MYLADNKDLEIKGKEDVCIKTLAGKSVDIKGCHIYSCSQEELISISQLDSTCYATELGKSSKNIMKGAMVVACGSKSGTLL